ncbi:MAG: hypothetical protein LBD90_01850, partial [Bifidobacteriaceae bacterium]|nr:hypothetical protein [Bifidobacteriaceae bacterium]
MTSRADQTPDQAPDQRPDQAPDQAPDQTPGQTPGQEPGQAPDRAGRQAGGSAERDPGQPPFVGVMIQAALRGESGPGPRWSRFPPAGRHRRLATAAWLTVMGGLAVAVGAELSAFSGGAGRPLMCALVAALTVCPLAFLGRSPLVAWRLMTVGLASAGLVTGQVSAWPWSVTGLVLYAIVLFIVAERTQTGL